MPKQTPLRDAIAATAAADQSSSLEARLNAARQNHAANWDNPESTSKAEAIRKMHSLTAEDVQRIDDLRDRYLGLHRSSSQSQVVRAGLWLLAHSDDETILAAFDALPVLPHGRRKKSI